MLSGGHGRIEASESDVISINNFRMICVVLLKLFIYSMSLVFFV